MLGLIIAIGALFALIVGTVGLVFAILWARQHAPNLFMGAMFLVLGALTYVVGHAFGALDTGAFGTLPAKVDVSALAPLDRVQAQLSNIRTDLTRVVPWVCVGFAVVLTGLHFWPMKSAASDQTA